MNNKALTQLWAKQSKPSGKGSNLFFEGGKLYSYGYHFLVAEIIGDTVRFNPEKYSQSTTRHQSLARAAASQANLKFI